jgi:elongation factor G
VFAHVDAGKTTVTERMLALSGIVRNAGSVDGGDTVTDYLPAERERGITIQSAAVGFGWVVPIRSKEDTNSSFGGERSVEINLIDTPGHVDFSVEVHRSVAVLDGAVLVIDAVAGVQAQTETVWRAIRNTDRTNNNNDSDSSARSTSSAAHGSHQHEPLPAMMYINKMDRDGADFRHAIETVEKKLKGSNPVPVQLPLYRVENDNGQNNRSTSIGKNDSTTSLGADIVAGTLNQAPPHGEFIGLVDILHMRALIYPPGAEYLSIEDAIPTVVNLLSLEGDRNCQPLDAALDARRDLIARLADVDEVMEDLYLNAMEDEDDGSRCPILSNISTSQIQSSLQRMTLSRSIMPTMCGAALRGIGVEPVLDGVAEFLPCPLDRLPPQLSLCSESHTKQQSQQQDTRAQNAVMLGHPLHPSTLAYVFKVVHMKGRGGSGDGRVAFARVYSGALKARDTVRVISPSSIAMNEDAGKHKKNKHPTERVGGMLELSGGKFDNLPEGKCLSGDVCALVGLKGVVTGDTLLLTSASTDSLPGDQMNSKKKKGKNGKSNDDHWKQYMEGVHLAGLTSPRPVLTLRIEATSSSEQSRLSAALALLTVEDPSLVVKETPTNTLISGLGELHMEVVLDRLRREFGLEVRTGKPAVAYRETVLFDDDGVETDGFVEYDRTVGGVQLQGAVRLRLSPSTMMMNTELCVPPEDPLVTLSPETREFFNMDPIASADETEHKYPPALRALLSGARGSLKRGRLGPYPLANLTCHILDVESEMTSPETLPGAMRAAAANAVTVLLETLNDDGRLVILEPKMTVEVSVPTNRVGDVLSDLTARRGAVDDVATGDDNTHAKSMVHAEVPLIEILGYANSLRSLTGGEGAFSAEYKGHAQQ